MSFLLYPLVARCRKIWTRSISIVHGTKMHLLDENRLQTRRGKNRFWISKTQTPKNPKSFYYENFITFHDNTPLVFNKKMSLNYIWKAAWRLQLVHTDVGVGPPMLKKAAIVNWFHTENLWACIMKMDDPSEEAQTCWTSHNTNIGCINFWNIQLVFCEKTSFRPQKLHQFLLDASSGCIWKSSARFQCISSQVIEEKNGKRLSRFLRETLGFEKLSLFRHKVL